MRDRTVQDSVCSAIMTESAEAFLHLRVPMSLDNLECSRLAILSVFCADGQKMGFRIMRKPVLYMLLKQPNQVERDN